MTSICVFCGSSDDAPHIHVQLAKDLGKALAENNIRLVYGGQFDGLMGVLADSMLEHQGDILGIVPETLWHPKADCISCIKTINLSERKDIMIQESDAFIVLPGGIGTLDEFIYVLTMKYIGEHNKPLILLDHEGYWEDLCHQFDHMLAKKYTTNESLSHFIKCKSVDEAVQCATAS